MRQNTRTLILIGVLSILDGREVGKKSVICTKMDAGECRVRVYQKLLN
jgi:hypothetical protein